MLSYERQNEVAVLLQRNRPFDVLLDMSFSLACAEPAAIEMLYKAFGEIPVRGEVPAPLVAALRELSGESEIATTAMVSNYLLHMKKLSGREPFYLVSIERFAQRDHIARTTQRFGLTPRETEVFALVLRGDRANDIARELSISPATVNDHLTNLLRKTSSRNRSEMLSKVMHP
jgi:DNA-binding CsgD family transcriptional regulator